MLMRGRLVKLLFVGCAAVCFPEAVPIYLRFGLQRTHVQVGAEAELELITE